MKPEWGSWALGIAVYIRLKKPKIEITTQNTQSRII